MYEVITNCINCGAPLHNGKCEYCGTEYTDTGKGIKINGRETYFPVEIDGREYTCYLSHVKVEHIDLGTYRDMQGQLRRSPAVYKRQFTLTEL